MPTQTPGPIFAGAPAEVASLLAEQLRQNRHVGRFQTVSPSELAAMINRIVDYYCRWAGGDRERLGDCLDYIKNICFALSIPLAETAYALYLLRDGIVDQLPPDNEITKSDVSREVGRFFDRLVVDLLRRY